MIVWKISLCIYINASIEIRRANNWNNPQIRLSSWKAQHKKLLLSSVSCPIWDHHELILDNRGKPWRRFIYNRCHNSHLRHLPPFAPCSLQPTRPDEFDNWYFSPVNSQLASGEFVPPLVPNGNPSPLLKIPKLRARVPVAPEEDGRGADAVRVNGTSVRLGRTIPAGVFPSYLSEKLWQFDGSAVLHLSDGLRGLKNVPLAGRRGEATPGIVNLIAAVTFPAMRLFPVEIFVTT